MKVNEIIKKLRVESGLTQEQFGRAIFSDGAELTGAAISQYESGKRQVSIELLEKILFAFGYTLELKLVDKTKNSRLIEFYKFKASDEILKMSKKEQLEYIFVSKPIDIWGRILKVDIETLKLIPLDTIKILLEKALEEIDPIALKCILDKKHIGYERDYAYFVEEVKRHLIENSNLSKEIINEAKYFSFDMDTYYEGKGNLFYNLCNVSLLDEDECELDVSQDDIVGDDGYLDIDYGYNFGAYLFHSYIDKVEIK